MLGVAWSLATMFAVPLLAIEDAGARRAARRSAAIFRDRWGEATIGTVSVGFVAVVGSVPGTALVALGLAAGGAAGIALAAVGAVLLMAAVAISNTLQELFALAVYRQQVLDSGTFGLDPTQLDGFMKLKRRRLRRRRG